MNSRLLAPEPGGAEEVLAESAEDLEEAPLDESFEENATIVDEGEMDDAAEAPAVGDAAQ